MAVLKMKKLRLIMHRTRRDDILRELIARACVEIIPAEGSIKALGLESIIYPQYSEREELQAKQEKLERAIALLETQAPAVKRIRLRRQALEEHVLLDDTGLGFALKKAGEALELRERLAFVRTEQLRLKKLTEDLKLWLDVDVLLHLTETESCKILLGTLPLAAQVEKLSTELEHIDEKAELFVIKEDKKLKYIGLLCMKARADEMRAMLEVKGFVSAPVPDTQGKALQCTSDAAGRIQELAREEEHTKKLLAEESVHLEALQLAADRVGVKLTLAAAEEKLYGTECAVYAEGWLPEKHEAELAALFERYGCAYDMSEPTDEEKADVPILLEGGDEQKRDMLRPIRLGLRKGRSFEPLKISTKYNKLAQ